MTAAAVTVSTGITRPFELVAAIAFQTQEPPVIETTAELALALIVVDESIQPRVELDEGHILDLVEAYEQSQPVTAATVWKIGDLYKLAEGFHRVAAMTRLKYASAEFYVKEGTEEECALNALCSNRNHGLKRSSADKRRCVSLLLKLNPAFSSPKVAEMAGVGANLVLDVRKKLEERAEIPKVEEREGRDGKTRKSVQIKPASPQRVESDVAAPAAKPQLVNKIAVPAEREDDGDPMNSLLGDPEVCEAAPLPVDVPTPIHITDADTDEYPTDARFMPNAVDAERIAFGMRDLNKRVESVIKDLRKLFGDAHHVVAHRADLPDMLSNLKSVSHSLSSQLPELPCPECCGTTTLPSGDQCRICNGYGIIDREHYAINKPKWKRTVGRYKQLKAEFSPDSVLAAEEPAALETDRAALCRQPTLIDLFDSDY